MITRTQRNAWALPANAALALVCLAVLGCQRAANTYDATVQGAVTIDGELAPRGTVTFHPVKAGAPSSGPIHEDGSYSIRTGQGDLSNPDGGTIRSGEYVVTVTVTSPPSAEQVVAEGGPPATGARMMADKYAAKETSDLKVEVKAGPNIINLKLDGPWANPPQEETADEADAEETEAANGEEADEGNDADDAVEADASPTEEAPADEEATGSEAAEEQAQPTDEAAAPTTDDTATPADQPAATEGQP
jgi:hypothetical protein